LNFNSLIYLCFLALNVILYYILPPKIRNYQLLAASYLFYMCWSPKYSLLMLLSTLITYVCGLLVDRSALGKRKLWLVLSFVSNLAILFFFKYFNFTADIITRTLNFVGLHLQPTTLNVLLPVGISFYTFQALGYTVDVYRKDIQAERNFADYALFVSFFPQLVAGPIERSGNMFHQLKEYHPFRLENIRDGILPILWGLFKKMVLADNLAVAVNTVYNAPGEHSGGEFIIATLAFAIQIYCDFSAYSDIARGSAKMMGFDLMKNFHCPYLAVSIQDFWRRWHISLSSWFKDYLYFPLGGSRCSKAHHLLNIMIVFTVSGLWHGAALTFVIWGILNGLYQVVSKLLDPLRKKLFTLLHIRDGAGWLHILRVLITFCLTCIAWIFFRANTLSDALHILHAILGTVKHGFIVDFSTSFSLSAYALLMVLVCTVVLLVADWFISEKDLAGKINQYVVPRYAVYFILIAVILLFGSYGAGYDPQDFVYFQF